MEGSPQFLVGTASWTDPSLVKSDAFYPPDAKTAEDRLRFYAANFATVEVDSTYYAIVSERNAQLWAERTPDRFVFNVKAFSLLTQHAADLERMPKELKEMLSRSARAERRLKYPPPALLDLSFQMFWSALGPLRAAGKLGLLLFQFPPYFVKKPVNLDYLASLGDKMPGARIAIEFRHQSWIAERRARDETMALLRRHDLAYVSVDAPAKAALPPLLEVTGPAAYVRFHGRNSENWRRRGITVAERYKYLYAERELAEWAGRLKTIRGVERAYVIFNNCYRNFGIMNAATMAQILSHPDRR